ncbi:UDP-Glycosyltransferase/glycogen phosphorylase [Trametes meyenii]|nr:UDP-Glycosyltransferase/glycogen phosphorylase [Trametes meyenii]
MDATKHILLLPMNMWGHVRPMCIFAGRIVKLRPSTRITFIISARLISRISTELNHDFRPEEANRLEQITLVPLEQPDSGHATHGVLFEAAFVEAWAKVLEGATLPGRSAGTNGTTREIDLRRTPLDAAIVDMFMVRAFSALRTLRHAQDRGDAAGVLKPAFKLHTWFPSAINCIGSWFTEDRTPHAEQLAVETGVSFDVAAHQLLMASRGEVIRSPYLPPMYDYEIHPQAAPVPPDILRDTDGIITFDAADYHPEATAWTRAWLAQTNRKIVFAGPLVACARMELPVAGNTSDLLAFLDAQLASRGERSVVLISFGSMFWPSDPAKVGAVLDVLIDRDIPFVLSRCSPFASMPDETKTKLAEYSGAYVSDWILQQEVLNHPAMGWCITHVGHNTVLECILAAVPMILWPIDADQAPNAVYLTDTLRVAYELLEVRHGTGLGPIFRTGVQPSGTLDAVRVELQGVLAQAFGDDGEAKRARVKSLGTTLGSAWADGGAAKREVEELLDAL